MSPNSSSTVAWTSGRYQPQSLSLSLNCCCCKSLLFSVLHMVLLLPLLSSSSSSGSKPSLQIFSDGSSSSPLFLFLLLDMFLERGFWILHCYCALITEILCEILEPLGSNCWLLKTKKLHFNANQLSLCLHSQDPSLGLPMQMGLYVMADMTFLLRTEGFIVFNDTSSSWEILCHCRFQILPSFPELDYCFFFNCKQLLFWLLIRVPAQYPSLYGNFGSVNCNLYCLEVLVVIRFSCVQVMLFH